MATQDLTRTAYDVLIIGYGIAGVSAAIEAADRGARVLVLDRGHGGGATALSGGVVYAGGGTRYQNAAGQSDSPENLFNYLKQETGGCVSDATLRRFSESSAAMIDWLEDNGAEFQASLCPYKTSYPTDEHFLYHSGNEKAWPYTEHATPAARGHRMLAPGLASGKALFAALSASAKRKGVNFQPLSKVDELLIEDGRVVGARYRTIVSGDPVAAKHKRFAYWGGKLGNWVPAIGSRIVRHNSRLWEEHATQAEVRANAVILCAGGFVFNAEMLAKYAGGYRDMRPLGTDGDDGSGIRLGVSAGGATAYLDHMTAWRFLSPPSAFAAGISVGPSGLRIANEDLYGATHAHIMISEHQGRGWLILDAQMWRTARAQARTQGQMMHKFQFAYLFTVGHKRARSIQALANKIGVPAAALIATVDAYNTGISSKAGDPAHKAPDLCAPIKTEPYYAINISIKNAEAFPAPGLTLGGLRVDERDGSVLTPQRAPIPGLYAAGRTAVGICSNGYISGLSLADGVFSGRRAAVGALSASQPEIDDRHLL